ncbi:hypothetical protein D3C85_1105920 [compost metagenome]
MPTWAPTTSPLKSSMPVYDVLSSARTTKPSPYSNTGSENCTTFSRSGVRTIAAEMMSILLAVRDGISEAKVVCAISTSKPAALETASTVSIIMPWILLLFTSRKVKGAPVAVAPTLNVSA